MSNQMNANTQTDELKETQLNFLSFLSHQQQHQHHQSNLVQQSQIGSNFDFIASLAASQHLIENQLIRPKILKMIDTLQTYLDLNNEKLIEQIGKHREHELIDLARKSSDLTHRQKLQSLLIESISSNDFRKASFIHSYLGDQPIATHHLNDVNYTHSDDMTNNMNGNDFNNNINNNNHNEADDEYNMNEYDSSPVKNETYLNTNTYNSINNNNNNNNYNNNSTDYDDNNNSLQITNNIVNSPNKPTNSQQCVSEPILNLNESLRDALTKVKKANPLSPIRHLICSPGLEAKAQNCKIIILYRGRCNGICYQNKPWSKEMHIHYIINTVNCNDHVSRLVKKQGIQFYNSFVLQNQERIRQLIQMYKMEKV